MPENTRFLLGFGERLTARIPPPSGGGGSEPAYTFTEAAVRLTPMLQSASSAIELLPRGACPNDEAVGVLTLHPQWMAKSYHPAQLLNEYNLRQVGSRPTSVEPERWTRQSEPEASPTTDIYVAGRRGSFRQWADDLERAPERVSDQIRRLEQVRAPEVQERLRNLGDQRQEEVLLEVVLHVSSDPEFDYIVAGFDTYARSLGAQPDLERRLYAGGLCFLPVDARTDAIADLARFAFLRVARPMPRLRSLTPIERAVPAPGARPCPLPDEDPVDPDLRVAAFDGGLATGTALNRWSTSFDGPGVGNPHNDLLEHGHAVTSALLFGPLEPGQAAPRPYSRVDHHRVLDDKADSDPYELYDVLRRVEAVLASKQYQFFNLSIGPAWPIEDDEVHPWTALLDEHLSDGHALAAIAVGNNGNNDHDSGEARVQVPADCVNALSIGAADSTRDGWARADYSAVGPGRSPGLVKPDVLQFGGCDREPFHVYSSDDAPDLATTAGTSFASPSALRLGIGVRAHFGERLSPLALKALLVHSAGKANLDRTEVGWGRLPADLDELVLCADGMVRIVYQGELNPAQYLRALVPLPDKELAGLVKIAATFCYASHTDPQDPGAYTRSGLDIVFRPDSRVFNHEESTDPATKPFFRRTQYDTEHTLRRDAMKWDSTLHAEKQFRGSSLHQATFDIHYNARSSGGAAHGAEKIRYALVLTVRSRRTPELYDQVLRTYAGVLEALQPVIEIPVRV